MTDRWRLALWTSVMGKSLPIYEGSSGFLLHITIFGESKLIVVANFLYIFIQKGLLITSFLYFRSFDGGGDGSHHNRRRRGRVSRREIRDGKRVSRDARS